VCTNSAPDEQRLQRRIRFRERGKVGRRSVWISRVHVSCRRVQRVRMRRSRSRRISARRVLLLAVVHDVDGGFDAALRDGLRCRWIPVISGGLHEMIEAERVRQTQRTDPVIRQRLSSSLLILSSVPLPSSAYLYALAPPQPHRCISASLRTVHRHQPPALPEHVRVVRDRHLRQRSAISLASSPRARWLTTAQAASGARSTSS
jgi:hypothetical protein